MFHSGGPHRTWPQDPATGPGGQSETWRSERAAPHARIDDQAVDAVEDDRVLPGLVDRDHPDRRHRRQARVGSLTQQRRRAAVIHQPRGSRERGPTPGGVQRLGLGQVGLAWGRQKGPGGHGPARKDDRGGKDGPGQCNRTPPAQPEPPAWTSPPDQPANPMVLRLSNSFPTWTSESPCVAHRTWSSGGQRRHRETVSFEWSLRPNIFEYKVVYNSTLYSKNAAKGVP